MFLGGQTLPFSGQLSQTATNAETRIARLDHIVDITILRCLIRIGKHLGIFFFLLGKERPNIFARIFLSLCFLGTEHSHSSRCPHNGNFGRGPGKVQIGT